MLNKKDLRELIEATRQQVNLREAVIEKDFYVTQVIHKLSGVENEYFRLVFCGGTCLAKAHKLVQRMSEDVDFKIQLKASDNFSESRFRNELKKFRADIRSVLVLPDLSVTNDFVRNEGKYQQITLQYPRLFLTSSALRPDIKVEFTFANALLPTDDLQVKTLIEDILSEINLFESPLTKCTSINETAIEKWVGLTRRIMAIERGYEEDDKTLIRHLYDLYAIDQANNANTNFAELARIVAASDGEQFKNKHPEYAKNPGLEIQQSLAVLKSNALWKERYDEFIEVMVYSNSRAPQYEHAIDMLERMSALIIDSFDHRN